jgi:hypothetical protein
MAKPTARGVGGIAPRTAAKIIEPAGRAAAAGTPASPAGQPVQAQPAAGHHGRRPSAQPAPARPGTKERKFFRGSSARSAGQQRLGHPPGSKEESRGGLLSVRWTAFVVNDVPTDRLDVRSGQRTGGGTAVDLDKPDISQWRLKTPQLTFCFIDCSSRRISEVAQVGRQG